MRIYLTYEDFCKDPRSNAAGNFAAAAAAQSAWLLYISCDCVFAPGTLS